MKYLIIGSGGTGGSIGGFLGMKKENQVAFISRGKNLEAIRKNGLILSSGIKGEIHLKDEIKVFSKEEYNEKADVIFICVKTYSIDEILYIVENACKKNTVIIPVMNGFNVGEKIADKIKKGIVLDGCMYISAYVDSPGNIVQLGKLFKVVFGPRKNQVVDMELLKKIKNDLNECNIETKLSNSIWKDTFLKFSFISTYAACGAYYDIDAGKMQEEGIYRSKFISLNKEIFNIGKTLELMDVDCCEANLQTLDKLTKDTTASTQKDIKKGNKSEIDSLIFEVVRLGQSLNVNIDNYEEVSVLLKSNI